MTEISREWLDYARRDLLSAEHLLTMWPVPVEIICFLCQQCAEKSLKGVLVEHNCEPPKTHDLNRLCKLCEDLDARFARWKDMCSDLAPYASRSRYPNGPEVTEEDMRVALKGSRKVFSFVCSVLEERPQT